MNFIEVIGFKVFSDNLSKISLDSDKCRVINTISPNSYGITTRDKEFNSALKTTDYLVLDGVYFAFASILLKGKNLKRNQGPDVFYHFMKRLNEEGRKAFFFGSTKETLQIIREKSLIKYPQLKIDYLAPPFKPVLSDMENREIISKINNFQPDVLFVAMTCPKQEKWAIKHRNQIKAGLIICIGNVFDWYAGTQKSIHPIWYKLRLAWFIRIFLRPEIFRRNIGNQMKFFWHLLLFFFKLKKYD